MGQLVGFSALDMAALGDWQTKGDVPEDARMPLHYSGQVRGVLVGQAQDGGRGGGSDPPRILGVQEAAQAGQAAAEPRPRRGTPRWRGQFRSSSG